MKGKIVSREVREKKDYWRGELASPHDLIVASWVHRRRPFDRLVRQGSPRVVRQGSPRVVRQGSPRVVRQGSPRVRAGRLRPPGPLEVLVSFGATGFRRTAIEDPLLGIMVDPALTGFAIEG